MFIAISRFLVFRFSWISSILFLSRHYFAFCLQFLMLLVFLLLRLLIALLIFSCTCFPSLSLSPPRRLPPRVVCLLFDTSLPFTPSLWPSSFVSFAASFHLSVPSRCHWSSPPVPFLSPCPFKSLSFAIISSRLFPLSFCPLCFVCLYRAVNLSFPSICFGLLACALSLTTLFLCLRLSLCQFGCYFIILSCLP